MNKIFLEAFYIFWTSFEIYPLLTYLKKIYENIYFNQSARYYFLQYNFLYKSNKCYFLLPNCIFLSSAFLFEEIQKNTRYCCPSY